MVNRRPPDVATRGAHLVSAPVVVDTFSRRAMLCRVTSPIDKTGRERTAVWLKPAREEDGTDAYDHLGGSRAIAGFLRCDGAAASIEPRASAFIRLSFSRGNCPMLLTGIWPR